MVSPVLLAVAAGVVLGAIYTLSPMTVWFVVFGAGLVHLAGRGLPQGERRWIRTLIVAALAVRAAMIAALFLFGTPDRVYVPFNVFFGDEQYMIIRALRHRAMWLGVSMRLDAFTDIFEIYGRTSYLQLLAFLQLLVGPAPYGAHLLNILLFVAGGIILHRIVRLAFGLAPAMGALVFLLFLPSLMLWSSAALKESLNFLIVVSTLGSAILAVRAPWRWRPFAAAGVLAGILVLATLRDGAVEIAAAGLGAGVVASIVTRRAWLLATAVVVAVVMTGPVLRTPGVHAAAMTAVQSAARKHTGHAYTRGHSYALLDDVYYGRRDLHEMTDNDAIKYVARSIVSVVVFPAPWQMRSMAELLYLPEQVVWYVALFCGSLGFVVGLRRDRLVTCLFGGYAAVALLAIAVNSGNMGTLVRHRALALPYLGALAALGLTSVLARFAASPTRTS